MQETITPVPIYGMLSPHAADPDKIAVTAGLPYPELTVDRPNLDYARILLSDTGGSKGELTSICQYLYDDWRLHQSYSSIADTFLRIAEVEMHHLDLLSRLIILLGGDPRCEGFHGDVPVPWNGNMLEYSADVNQMIRRSLSLEEAAVEAYQSQARQIEDANVSAILLRIALDEQIHVGILKNMLKRGR